MLQNFTPITQYFLTCFLQLLAQKESCRTNSKEQHVKETCNSRDIPLDILDTLKFKTSRFSCKLAHLFYTQNFRSKLTLVINVLQIKSCSLCLQNS